MEILVSYHFLYQAIQMMNYDTDKVDEATLALLYLVMFSDGEGYGDRAWKSFDWDTMDRLHEKGWISKPQGKAKSVSVSEEGAQKAEALFNKMFQKDE